MGRGTGGGSGAGMGGGLPASSFDDGAGGAGGSAGTAHARMRYQSVGGMMAAGQEQAGAARTTFSSAGELAAAAGGNRGMMGMVASALATSPLVAAVLGQLGKKKQQGE